MQNTDDRTSESNKLKMSLLVSCKNKSGRQHGTLTGVLSYSGFGRSLVHCLYIQRLTVCGERQFRTQVEMEGQVMHRHWVARLWWSTSTVLQHENNNHVGEARAQTTF